MKARVAGAAALAVALACSACSPAGPGSAASGSASPVPSVPATASPVATATPESQVESECPVGYWILDNESWDAALTEIWNQELPGSEVQISGELLLDWNANGTYTLVARDSMYVVTGSSDGTAFTQTILHNGTESGTWVHGGGDVFTLTATDESTWDSSVTMEAGGASYSVDQSTLPAEPWSGSMDVACGVQEMTTTVTEEQGTIAVDFLARSQ